MKYWALTIGLSAAVLLGCDAADSAVDVPVSWVTIDARKEFCFKAPPDLVETPVKGKDSFVGTYNSPALELSFDYGQYSDPLENEGHPDWTFRTTTIDGKRAKIGWSVDRCAVYFPSVVGNDKLSMFAKLKQPGAKETAERIFRSIDFP